MKYIVCEKPGEFILKEKEKPRIKAGEAILKVKKVGICGKDYLGQKMVRNGTGFSALTQ